MEIVRLVQCNVITISTTFFLHLEHTPDFQVEANWYRLPNVIKWRQQAKSKYVAEDDHGRIVCDNKRIYFMHVSHFSTRSL